MNLGTSTITLVVGCTCIRSLSSVSLRTDSATLAPSAGQTRSTACSSSPTAGAAPGDKGKTVRRGAMTLRIAIDAWGDPPPRKIAPGIYQVVPDQNFSGGMDVSVFTARFEGDSIMFIEQSGSLMSRSRTSYEGEHLLWTDGAGWAHARDVKPGELVVISDAGIESFMPFPPQRPRFCIFEYVYFARPDSVVNGRSVYEVRKRMGQRLAIVPRTPAEVPLVDAFIADMTALHPAIDGTKDKSHGDFATNYEKYNADYIREGAAR